MQFNDSDGLRFVPSFVSFVYLCSKEYYTSDIKAMSVCRAARKYSHGANFVRTLDLFNSTVYFIFYEL